MDSQLEKGHGGQFDIIVDGDVVAGRTGGLWKKLIGGGWPDEEDVIQLLQQRLKARADV